MSIKASIWWEGDFPRWP